MASPPKSLRKNRGISFIELMSVSLTLQQTDISFALDTFSPGKIGIRFDMDAVL